MESRSDFLEKKEEILKILLSNSKEAENALAEKLIKEFDEKQDYQLFLELSESHERINKFFNENKALNKMFQEYIPEHRPHGFFKAGDNTDISPFQMLMGCYLWTQYSGKHKSDPAYALVCLDKACVFGDYASLIQRMKLYLADLRLLLGIDKPVPEVNESKVRQVAEKIILLSFKLNNIYRALGYLNSANILLSEALLLSYHPVELKILQRHLMAEDYQNREAGGKQKVQPMSEYLDALLHLVVEDFCFAELTTKFPMSVRMAEEILSPEIFEKEGLFHGFKGFTSWSKIEEDVSVQLKQNFAVDNPSGFFKKVKAEVQESLKAEVKAKAAKTL